MKFSTKGRIGKNSKAVRVETNDPAKEKFNLKLTGEVKKFVIIKPSTAILKGTVGEKISQVVTVAPGTDEPLQILNASTLNKGDFRYSMKETEVDGKKAYEFLIENTRMTAGRYLDKIFILTNKMEQNPITINVRGDIQEKILLNNSNILN